MPTVSVCRSFLWSIPPERFPASDAEERGQAEAIARATDASLSLGVPSIAVILGEGGSGGAIAIASCNRVLMLEHAIYTVASPEASASILWRDASRAEDAATNMKITAQDLLKFGIIDSIVVEPVGGAHRDPDTAINAVGDAIAAALDEFSGHVASRDQGLANREILEYRTQTLSLIRESGNRFREKIVRDQRLGAWSGSI